MTAVAEFHMDSDAARRITERIRLTALNVREGLEKLQGLVEQAKTGNAHLALGYPSWTAYLADTLGDQPLRLPRDQRQEIVGYLAGEGMSTRAIAPIVGASQMTVVRDLEEPTETNVSVERPATVTSLDGRERPATRAVEVVTREVVDVTTGEIAPARAPQRRAITDQFFDACHDLGRLIDRIERLTADDRFPRNAEQVSAKHREDLLRARAVLDDVLGRLA